MVKCKQDLVQNWAGRFSIAALNDPCSLLSSQESTIYKQYCCLFSFSIVFTFILYRIFKYTNWLFIRLGTGLQWRNYEGGSMWGTCPTRLLPPPPPNPLSQFRSQIKTQGPVQKCATNPLHRKSGSSPPPILNNLFTSLVGSFASFLGSSLILQSWINMSQFWCHHLDYTLRGGYPILFTSHIYLNYLSTTCVLGLYVSPCYEAANPQFAENSLRLSHFDTYPEATLRSSILSTNQPCVTAGRPWTQGWHGRLWSSDRWSILRRRVRCSKRSDSNWCHFGIKQNHSHETNQNR